ncbi:hypothetical protein KRR39_08320 [Nocardioides panacis]|uniref:Sulfotransferase family protein n=1 Tax=Nocardioides panacis TaxID=2849501 RepID=A0A975Y1P6_9ACTN|nr:hypothetical protein KRR39_08320 [Nocardioides panacis]
MVLQLIGSGLPRTGTSSLREALRHLLGAPVYHMSEAFAHPDCPYLGGCHEGGHTRLGGLPGRVRRRG